MNADPGRPTVAVELHVPAPVLTIARTLHDAGFATWCVGGAVRDAMLGRANLDWDIATAALPAQVKALFRRTVPVGIEFGTIGVLDGLGIMHEVTTFRRDVQTDGRHAVVQFGASLDDDLARRDFTINAIAYDPIERRLYDPFDGLHDLTRGVIRAVGIAEDRMNEDRLRALRAIRFASRFGFAFDGETWAAVVNSAPFLGRLSPERVKQEIEKTMEQVSKPSRAFVRWRDAGAFASLVPALADIADSTLASLDCLPQPGVHGRPQRRALRIAALFAGVEGGVVEKALRGLRFSNQDVAWIAALVERVTRNAHVVQGWLMQDGGPRDAQLRRLAADTGRLRCASFVRLASARWAVLPVSERPSASAVRSLHRRLLCIAFHDAIETGDLAIDGDDLRHAGVPPGPRMGRLMGELLEDVIENPANNTREWLLHRAEGLIGGT